MNFLARALTVVVAIFLSMDVWATDGAPELILRRQVTRAQKLPPGETNALIAIIKNPEAPALRKQAALEKILQSVYPAISAIARQWAQKNPTFEYMDLFQTGVEGAIHSVGLYDSSFGRTWASYANDWIRAFIIRAVTDDFRERGGDSSHFGKHYFFVRGRLHTLLQSKGIPYSAEAMRDAFNAYQLERSREWIGEQLRGGRLEATEENIAKVLASDGRAATTEQVAQAELSIANANRPIGLLSRKKSSLDDDEKLCVADLLASSEDVSDSASEREIQNLIDQVAREMEERLSGHEKIIFQRRILAEWRGLQDTAILKEVAVEVRLSRERVRIIEGYLRPRFERLVADRLSDTGSRTAWRAWLRESTQRRLPD